MDNLAEYRARHSQQYNQRVKEEHEKELQIAAKLAAIHAERERINHFNNTFIKTVENLSTILLICDLPEVMSTHLNELNTNLESHITNWNDNKDPEMMKHLCDVVLKVFESVNQNNITKINFNNRNDIEISKQIRQTMNAILSKVGIQHEDDNLEVEYEMDCTADEEFARQLYLEDQARNNILPINFQNNPIDPLPNRRQRRRRNIATNNIEPVVNNTNTNVNANADVNVNTIIDTPRHRGRGRPRRNPIV